MVLDHQASANFANHFVSFICHFAIDKQSKVKVKSIIVGCISEDESKIKDDIRNIVQRDSCSSNILLPIIYKMGNRMLDDLYIMSQDYFEQLTMN